MAQYDLLLIQNTSGAGTEYSEKTVNIGKGALLSGAADGTPTVLAAGTDGYMLVRDDAEATGLKWVVVSGGHTQNTDTGTTGNTFTIDSDSATGKIILDVELGASDNSLTITNEALDGNRVFTIPNDSGTALITADSTVTSGYLVITDGTTGHKYKAGTGAPGTMAYETATNYVAKSLFDANTILYATSDNTPAALTIGEQTIVGRKTSGNIAALTPAEAMNILWVSAPATKTSSGTAGQIAKDTNFFYVCTGTDVWKRTALATNW